MLKMALGVAADDRGDSLNPEGVVESDVDACGPAGKLRKEASY